MLEAGMNVYCRHVIYVFVCMYKCIYVNMCQLFFLVGYPVLRQPSLLFICPSYDGSYYGMGSVCLLSVQSGSVKFYLVNVITCEIIDPSSPNSVRGFFMGRSRMSSYLSHLDLLSRSLGSTQCIRL